MPKRCRVTKVQQSVVPAATLTHRISNSGCIVIVRVRSGPAGAGGREGGGVNSIEILNME